MVAAASGEFTTQFPDIFEKYRMPYLESGKLVQAWNSNPMQFWQSQVNLAVWCATIGCGVSFKDHLEAADPLTKSLISGPEDFSRDPGAAAPVPSVECLQQPIRQKGIRADLQRVCFHILTGELKAPTMGWVWSTST